MVLLARLVWDVDPRIALAAIAAGLVGCVIQSAASLLGLGREGPIAAFFFGILMVLYGSLLIRSTAVPSFIGIMFIIAGLGWCAPVVPSFPAAALGAVVQGFGGLTEVVLAVWLLIHG